MCGIIGAVVTQRNVTPILLEGLKRLEYRGYDSAGIAVYDLNQKRIVRSRTKGKVSQLLEHTPPLQCLFNGHVGIAHTRWATHGKPSKINAHPHMTAHHEMAIVHNGIIENHHTLRNLLENNNYCFSSETDTEVIIHLIHFNLQKTHHLREAIFETIRQLEGSFALSILDHKNPNSLWAVRCGSPLAIGVGIEEYFITSDACALWSVTQQFIDLEEGDVAELTCQGYQIFNHQGQSVSRPIRQSQYAIDIADRGPYRHYMLKEIFEQPLAIQKTLAPYLSNPLPETIFGTHSETLPPIQHIQIVGCGTSYHAGLVARHWLESIAKIPCQVEIASELRYRTTIVQPHTWFIAISQSGETADTLAALRQAKALSYATTLAICNVPNSSLVRESDYHFITHAGPEISVASTKAFTTQLTALLLLTYTLQNHHTNHLQQHTTTHIQQLEQLPHIVHQALQQEDKIKQLASQLADAQHALFLGRGIHHPIAMEGALKLKEISYIHAEAYAAGELKHGPLALIDQHMPVIMLMPNNPMYKKLQSNLQEIKARGGNVFLLTDSSLPIQEEANIYPIRIPSPPALLSPIVYTVLLQLLAYYVAMAKGTDIDQPRHLAKSVTVE